jgi:hypothetical protein
VESAVCIVIAVAVGMAAGVRVSTVGAVAVLIGQARFLLVSPLRSPTLLGLAVCFEVAYLVALVTLVVSLVPFTSSLRLGGKGFC